MPKFVLVDRITRPKHSPGVNWGSDIVVLARRGRRELWKTPGAMASRYDYSPGEFILVDGAEESWRGYYSGVTTKVLQEGGRVSRKTFALHAEAINEFFGCEIADKLNTRKTLIVED